MANKPDGIKLELLMCYENESYYKQGNLFRTKT